MKRIIRLLILMILFVPMVALADMGAPDYITVKFVVSSQGEVPYYDDYDGTQKAGTLKSGDTVDLTDRSIVKGRYECTFEIAKGQGYELYYIFGDDCKNLKPFDENYNPANHLDHFEKKDTTILVYKDAKIFKGPSNAYEVIGTLPKGTEILSKYRDKAEIYYYVEYNGIIGFVDSYEDSIAFKESHDLLFFGDYKTQSCGTIPAGIKLHSDYWFDYHDGFIVNYNNCESVVSSFKTSYFDVYEENKDEEYEVLKTITVYEKPDNKGNKVATINKGEKVYIYASAYDGDTDEEMTGYEYVDYNGKKGFVKDGKYKKIEKEKTTTTTTQAVDDETTTTTDVPKDIEDDVKKTSIGIIELAIIAAITGIAIAVVAIVVIVLVNKGSKKNAEATVAEASPVTPVEETATTETPVETTTEPTTEEQSTTEEVKEETTNNEKDV